MRRGYLKNAVSVGSILETVFARLGGKSSLTRHRIIELWPRIVEVPVARHTSAERLSGSMLHVAVDSSVWMNELAAIKPVLLEKVNAFLGTDVAPITDIRFHQRSWACGTAPERPDLPVPPPTEEELRLMRKAMELVKDEELRKTLESLWEKDRRLKFRRPAKD